MGNEVFGLAPMILLFGFALGLLVGVKLEARRWREKGDHDYMNTIESGGALYTVKAEYEP